MDTLVSLQIVVVGSFCSSLCCICLERRRSNQKSFIFLSRSANQIHGPFGAWTTQSMDYREPTPTNTLVSMTGQLSASFLLMFFILLRWYSSISEKKIPKQKYSPLGSPIRESSQGATGKALELCQLHLIGTGYLAALPAAPYWNRILFCFGRGIATTATMW